MPRRRWAALLLAAAAVLPTAACSDVDEPGFVTASGSSFELDGQPFRFVGFNLYDAAASDRYSCSPASSMTDGELDEACRVAISAVDELAQAGYATGSDRVRSFLRLVHPYASSPAVRTLNERVSSLN